MKAKIDIMKIMSLFFYLLGSVNFAYSSENRAFIASERARIAKEYAYIRNYYSDFHKITKDLTESDRLEMAAHCVATQLENYAKCKSDSEYVQSVLQQKGKKIKGDLSFELVRYQEIFAFDLAKKSTKIFSELLFK